MPKNRNKGYTLLFAVIISSLVLAVGISILSISKKEFSLSSAARESTYAFYAADGGLECAIFFDLKEADNFSTSSPNGGNDVECGAGMSGIVMEPLVDDGGLFTFYVNTNDDGDTSCAEVKVYKEYIYNEDLDSVILQTKIESRGYNVGWDESDENCFAENPKKVERAMRLIY